MASDWIILAALGVLVVGVVLYFRADAAETPDRRQRRGTPRKSASHGR